MGVTTRIRDELRLARLKERLEDRPNNLHATVQAAHLEYYLGLHGDAERSIAHAIKLGHIDDGSMQVRLARIHVRRHNTDPSNSQRDLRAALASFNKALKFRGVECQAVHYLEITSVFLKLNETQRAANALSTILVRWPHSREAILARETCAQTLLARGQASEALHFYQALLVDPPPKENIEWQQEEKDHAEVDLPVAGSILGGESIFLQMGLCYEHLGRMKMATGAFRQAWNTLLKQRDDDLKRGAESRSNSIQANEAFRRDDVGIILRQARAALGIENSDRLGHDRFGNEEEGKDDCQREPAASEELPSNASKRNSTQAGGKARRSYLCDTRADNATRHSSSPRPLSGHERDRSSAREQDGGRSSPVREENRDDPSSARRERRCGVAKKEAAAKDAAARMLGFELWTKEPYTWFSFGERLLENDCFALALIFLDKATGLLPLGLQQQEKEKHLPVYMRRRRKTGDPVLRAPESFGLAQLHLLRAEAFFQLGRFSDAYSAAAEARDLEPFGREVRLRCPRLMALHSKDAGYQYTRESLSAARIQRAWRAYHVVHALRELVKKQIAAMRIQRFMREWTRCNRGMAIQLVTAGALELSRMKSAYARGMGLAAQTAAVGRHNILVSSALSAQRVGRALIARREATRRHEAITILQAYFRGCRERVALSAVLKERYRAFRRAADPYEGSICSAVNDEKNFLLGGEPKGEGRIRLQLESDNMCPIQVGIMTRRNVPMDAECPAGFDMPNLAAFLWKHWEENHGFDAETAPVERSQMSSGGFIVAACDEEVLEISARAFSASANTNGEQRDRHHGRGSHTHRRRSDFGEGPPPFFSPLHSSRRVVWAPVAVAPESSLAHALACSTLIANTPSFGSVCARRLFSRIGRQSPITPARAPPSSVSAETINGKTACNGTVSMQMGAIPSEKMTSHLLGDRLTHIMVCGNSPLGDGGLSELSSAIRRGLLPRLATLIIGGHGCRVGPRGVTALATALSSSGCARRLRTLSMSNCCLGQQSRHQQRGSPSTPLSPPATLRLATNASTAAKTAAHMAWDCLLRHLQRMTALLSLSLQDCGLDDSDMRPVSIAVQILPAGLLRCLRLSGNSISVKGLRVLLRALTSRKIRLPALWLRKQRPAFIESQTREVVKHAFSEGLFAEVEFERPRQVVGGRSQLALLEHTTESEDLGSRARKHPTSHIYV